jgi:predicted kinase
MNLANRPLQRARQSRKSRHTLVSVSDTASKASQPLLVVVTGPPATGKTTLAERLSRELALPLVAKDAIKERLYDALGSGDREWSRRLGRATYALMFDWVGRLLAARHSAIVESNFTPPAAPLFDRLPPHRTFQVFCTAPREVVIARYAARRRHDGHLDRVVLEELRAGLHEEQWQPLPLAGELRQFEIGNGDVEAIVARVGETLALA